MSTNGIQFTGLASGIDTSSIVDALMAVERLPLGRLETKKELVSDQRAVARELNGYVTALRDKARALFSPTAFSGKVATTGNASVATATASSTAANGTYNVTVGALAQTHTIQSVASPTMTDGDELDVTVGGVTKTYTYLDDDGLEGLVNDINDDGAVSASIVNGSLVLISETGGTAGAITTGGDAATALGFVTRQAAQDASATINGVAVTSSTNTIKGSVGGLDITLTGLGSTTVSVASDTDAIVAKAQAFVDAYNTVSKNFRAVTAYNAETEEAGLFQGDQTVSGFIFQVRSAVGGSVASLAGEAYDSLASIGITADKEGTLTLDTAAFKKALAADAEGVQDVFAATDGIAVATSTVANTYSIGALAAKISGYTAEIGRLDDRIEAMEERLVSREEALKARFSAAESAISAFQKQASALAGALS